MVVEVKIKLNDYRAAVLRAGEENKERGIGFTIRNLIQNKAVVLEKNRYKEFLNRIVELIDSKEKPKLNPFVVALLDFTSKDGLALLGSIEAAVVESIAYEKKFYLARDVPSIVGMALRDIGAYKSSIEALEEIIKEVDGVLLKKEVSGDTLIIKVNSIEMKGELQETKNGLVYVVNDRIRLASRSALSTLSFLYAL